MARHHLWLRIPVSAVRYCVAPKPGGGKISCRESNGHMHPLRQALIIPFRMKGLLHNSKWD
jgi:hypothetical protein